MTRIVCGLDDSDAAGPAAATAAWLGRALAAEVVAVRVPEGVRGPAEGKDVGDVAEAPARRLAQIADEEDALLLVVGSRGHGPVRSAVLGSVSREIAITARCPVVIVPPDAPVPVEGTPSNASVICGVDGSDHALAAVTVGVHLAQALGCRPVVVHALQDFQAALTYRGARLTTPPFTGQQDAQRAAADAIVGRARAQVGTQVQAVVEAGPPATVLEEVAAREHGLLLVLAARGLRPVQAALLGSTAARAAASSRRPVVLVSELAEEAMRPASGPARWNANPSPCPDPGPGLLG